MLKLQVNSKKKSNITNIIQASMIFFVLLFIFVFSLATSRYSNVQVLDDSLISLDDEWHYVDDNGKDKSILLPYTIENEADYIEVKKTLPEMEYDSYLEIFSKNMKFEVYFEDDPGNIIYTFGTGADEKTTGFIPNHHQLIKIKSDYSNKTICFRYYNNGTNSFSLSKATFGRLDVVSINFMTTHAFALATSLLSFIYAIIIFSFWIWVLIKEKSNISWIFFYLSGFFFCSGLYLMANSNIIHLFTNTFAPMAFLEYFMLILTAFFLNQIVGFVFSEKISSIRKVTYVTSIIIVSELLLSVLLHYTHLVSINVLIPYIFASFMIITFVIISFIIAEIRDHKSLASISILVGIILFTIAWIIALILNRLLNDYNAYIFVFSIGVLTLQIILIGIALYYLKIKNYEIQKNKLYESLAFTDTMTMIGNRNAYEKYITELASSKVNNATLDIVIIDINSLKFVNDIYGHKRGDDIIKMTAKILVTAFNGIESIYRIGGDEFIVIGVNNSRKITDGCGMLRRYIDEYNISNSPKLSFAYGHESRVCPGNMTSAFISEVTISADNMMYLYKRKAKNDE